MTKYLTSEEVMRRLQISKSTLYRWTKSGKLPHSRIGKKYHFNPYLLEKLLNDNKNIKNENKRTT